MQADQEFVENASQEEIIEEVQKENSLAPQSPPSGDLKSFLVLFEEIKESEEKIQKAIEFMRGRLASSASPRFREFWEVRKLCLPLFKEAISARARTDLWQQYVDLSVEARQLKEILDEQSAFAYEQIDLAVQALIQDLDSQQTLIIQMPEIDLLKETKSLEDKKESYAQIQKELHFLNGLAAKVNSLRKEVIKTDMRIRSKNKLFEKLSECGDRIFPRRKELIRKISEDFMEDVASFTSKYFVAGKEPAIPLHGLREEIKVLQSIAKLFTLNTHSFTDTRLKLSQAWDLLKEWEKERKKEFTEKKAKYQQNFDQIDVLVKEFEEFCLKEEDLQVIEKKVEEISQSMKAVELGRAEIKMLKDRLDEAKKPHEEKKRLELAECQEKERKQEEQRVHKVQEFRQQLQELIDLAATFSFEEMVAKRGQLEEVYRTLGASKAEKALFDRLFKQLKDRILEAKGRSLLSLSDDEQEQYEGLKQVLKEKKERRLEMKNQLEAYRKALGGSSFDFEKAMACRELMETEKKSLEKLNADIEEIEGKIVELEG